MTKKTNEAPQTITELIKDKSVFKEELQERIDLGETLLHGDDDKLISGFSEWTDYNDEYLKHAFNNTNNEYRKDYDFAGFSVLGPLSKYRYGSLEERKETLAYKIESLKKLVKKTDLLRSSIQASAQKTITNTLPVNKSEVFIVHGHDELAKVEVARFIEKLGFKPIILHEQASSGKTIIEKIEEYSNVGFGIVLYTPCDLGGKTETNLKNRARQNVVFEHGYLMGKIGRKNVCALVKGDIETPNDVSGVVYVGMDSAKGWQTDVAKELKSSGYSVDMNVLF